MRCPWLLAQTKVATILESLCTDSEGTPPPPPPPPPHLHLPWGKTCVSKQGCSETLGLHQNSTSRGLLWSPSQISRFDCVCLKPLPLMASYGLHFGILRNTEPLSELYLPWPPMVSTNEISVCLCLSLRNTKPLSELHLPWTPMVSTLAYSETLSIYQNSTSHGLLWSPH